MLHEVCEALAHKEKVK
jgi:hypothetical protein